MDQLESRTSPLVVTACWTLVLIPLAWGVVQSVVKSLPLLEAQQFPGANAPK
jgi:hypothetical protein